MNFYLSLLLVAAVAFTASGLRLRKRQAAEEETICGDSPCPTYTLEKTLSEGVEERKYNAFKVPSYTSTQCMTHSAALSQGYFHLAMYTRGRNNAESSPLRMGVPVLLEARHKDDVEERCSQIFTTSFYVNADNLPAPNNADIKIKDMTELHYYVYTFGGFVRSPNDRVLELREILNALELCYDPTLFYVAMYQGPGSLLSRRNEIWLPVRECTAGTK